MNAVIYARYSSHSQTEQSIEGQIRVNTEFAQREGYNIIASYIDRATSGTSADGRPEFQRMVNDAKHGAFQYIIVYKLDRFARNRFDSATYKHVLKQRGVKVISATESISDNPEGIILEAVLEASAEYYSQELSQKVKRGNRENIMKGKHLGGIIPMGYKTQNAQIFIDEHYANIMRFVFQSYADGMSKKEIVNSLNARGYRNRKNKPFTINDFQQNLKNRVYIGIRSYLGVDYTGIYPAIIDEDIFNRVQSRLKETARRPSASKAKVDYLLSGKVRCGHCGATMTGECCVNGNKVKYYYYHCSQRKKHKTCNKKLEPKVQLEDYVIEQTLNTVFTPSRMEALSTKVASLYQSEFDASNITSLEHHINSLKKDSDKYMNLLAKAENAQLISMYETQIINIQNQIQSLEIDLAKLKTASTITLTKEDILQWLQA